MATATLTLPSPKAEARTGIPSVEEIYRLHVGDVTRWAARLGGPRIELEDVVQEVFVLVQRELPSFRGEAKLTTWLYRITENVVRHTRRRRRWLGFFRKGDDPPEQASPDRTPLEDAEARQSRELIYRALDRMNDRYRTAIILFEIEDLPGEEVAERMGIKLNNLWVLLHRARAELTRRVAEISEATP